jgi:hypothetical protein
MRARLGRLALTVTTVAAMAIAGGASITGF